MTNFGRFARVTVGAPGSDGVLIDGNRIEFAVRKTDDPEANSLSVSITNLAPSSRRAMETTDNRIILEAGYALDVRQVAVGDITTGRTEYLPPDQVTTAKCGDGLKALANTRVSLSYSGAIAAQKVIDDIARSMGLNLRETAADLSGSYSDGWAFGGPARTALDKVTRRFGLSWSIQDEELQIVDRRGVNTREAVFISPSTGLIGSPLPVDDLRDNLEGDKEQPGVQITTLLNPLIEPGGVIVVDSREYREAEMRVKTVTHIGDTRGDAWQTVAEVVER